MAGLRRAFPWLLVALLVATSAAQATVPARVNGKTTIAPTGINVEDANVDTLRTANLYAPTLTANATATLNTLTATDATLATARAAYAYTGTLTANTTFTTPNATIGALVVGDTNASMIRTLGTANESALQIYSQKSDGRAELDLWVRQPPGYAANARAASWQCHGANDSYDTGGDRHCTLYSEDTSSIVTGSNYPHVLEWWFGDQWDNLLRAYTNFNVKGNTSLGVTINRPGTYTPALAPLEVGSSVAKLSVGSAYSSGMSYGEAYVGWNIARNQTTGFWQVGTDGAHNAAWVMWTEVGGGYRMASLPDTGGVTRTLTDPDIVNATVFRVGAYGNITFAQNAYLRWDNGAGGYYAQIRPESGTSDSIAIRRGDNGQYGDLWMRTLALNGIKPHSSAGNNITFLSRDGSNAVTSAVAQITTGSSYAFDLNKARLMGELDANSRNITTLTSIDWTTSTLGTCDSSATNRGREVWVEGGAGVADEKWSCRKGTDDVYRWMKPTWTT